MHVKSVQLFGEANSFRIFKAFVYTGTHLYWKEATLHP